MGKITLKMKSPGKGKKVGDELRKGAKKEIRFKSFREGGKKGCKGCLRRVYHSKRGGKSRPDRKKKGKPLERVHR